MNLEEIILRKSVVCKKSETSTDHSILDISFKLPENLVQKKDFIDAAKEADSVCNE